MSGSLPTQSFDYELPPGLIAQTPSEERAGSRLLVVDRARHAVEHRHFHELTSLLRKGDILFRNDAAVLPARLLAERPTGGKVECFLLGPEDRGQTTDDRRRIPELWRCLLKPGKKLPVGSRFADPDGGFAAEVISRHEDGSGVVRFEIPNGESVVSLARRIGHVPLPPYIERSDKPDDRERYQTVYANPDHSVAVAAPTAGLHFTPELLTKLSDGGVEFADLTLHVGLGTFRPIATDNVEDHPIHRELYEIPQATAEALRSGRRRIAVGTTAVRAIEDHFKSEDHCRASAGRTPQVLGVRPADALHDASIFIYPPYSFQCVDALITNFHLPRSTLLCLVSAFLAPGSTDGIGWLKEIYTDAIARKYRFLSYGDAMLIV